MGELLKLKGVGEKTKKLLNSVDIFDTTDLLFYYPRDYEMYKEPTHILDLKIDEISSINAMIVGKPAIYRKGNLNITIIWLDDGTARIRAYWFNMPYIKNILKANDRKIFRGKVSYLKNGMAISQPKVYSESEYKELIGKLNPIYSLTKGLKNNTIKKIVNESITQLNDENLTEYIPREILNQRNLCDLNYAIKHIHNPINFDDMLVARKRIVYDEFFIFSLAMQKNKKEANVCIDDTLKSIDKSHIDKYINKLPYELTDGQKKVVSEILSDIEIGKKVNRLIEGDVGSGKTIVAVLIALLYTSVKLQVAFMCPTEVLAKQHYENIKKLFGTDIKVELLTGSTNSKERKEILKKLLIGEIDILVGTHALFSDDVIYNNLGLCIIDEQHRFGVNQRKKLEEKGKNVSVIVMSATPIPRTLAMLIYADFDISNLKDKPKNRLPIKNCVIGKNDREKGYRAIKKEIDKGHQAYVICASIEKNEDVGSFSNYENVIEYSARLKEFFGNDINIGVLHGKMNIKDKNDIMERFKNREIDILVSTTVVEVGVDVSNATFIMVEDAGAFGLSELHQLRGRVGRSENQSYALFVDTMKTEKSIERLNVINSSNDGFYIAEEDLRLRGPGDIFGVRQSGDMEFKMADMYSDIKIFKEASEDAKKFANNKIVIAKNLKDKLDKYMNNLTVL